MLGRSMKANPKARTASAEPNSTSLALHMARMEVNLRSGAR